MTDKSQQHKIWSFVAPCTCVRTYFIRSIIGFCFKIYNQIKCTVIDHRSLCMARSSSTKHMSNDWLDKFDLLLNDSFLIAWKSRATRKRLSQASTTFTTDKSNSFAKYCCCAFFPQQINKFQLHYNNKYATNGNEFECIAVNGWNLSNSTMVFF